MADSDRLRAEDGIRTRDLNLGKVALYQLSYFRAFAYRLILPVSIVPAKTHSDLGFCHEQPAVAQRPSARLLENGVPGENGGFVGARTLSLRRHQ